MAIMMRCVPSYPHRDMTIDEFKAWLRSFDANHDGRINEEELEEALHSLKTWFAWFKARQGIKEADSNRNGLVEYNNSQEIEKLVIFAQQKLHMKIRQSSSAYYY
ncbi:hypothetical protein ACFE04_023433 [Oxalis oulophora]